LEQSSNVAEEAEQIKLGKNHLLVLNLLLERQGEAARIDLAKETGLKDSNLSHILSKLAASRLIDRIPIGREASIRITDQGRKTVSDRERPSPQNRDDFPARACEWLPYPLAIVNANASSVKCNEAFARILETTSDRLEKMPAETLRQSLAAKVQDAELGELMGADGCAHRLIETVAGDYTFWLSFDVSMYRRRIDELEKRESVLAHELTHVSSLVASAANAPRFRGRNPYTELCVAPYDFAGMIKQMSRHVMTPISSIAATARLLLASKYFKGDDRHYLSAIVGNSDHLKSVLGGMIAVADADPFAHVVVPFHPNSIAKEIADNFAVSSKTHGYTIIVDHSGEDREVFADAYAFKAALQSTVADVVRVVSRGASVGISTITLEDGIEVELVAKDIDTSRHPLRAGRLRQGRAPNQILLAVGAPSDQIGKDFAALIRNSLASGALYGLADPMIPSTTRPRQWRFSTTAIS
jgi:DNA-binding MarR family transcriptional regulator